MPKIKLDMIDHRILDEIQADGRITNQALAERVGLSPSPCLRRVRALEDAGVIKGYVGLVNPDAAGLPVTAFVRVRLGTQDDKHLVLFEETVAAFSEVMECYLMTGECDYQLRVVLPPEWGNDITKVASGEIEAGSPNITSWGAASSETTTSGTYGGGAPEMTIRNSLTAVKNIRHSDLKYDEDN